MRTSSKKSQPKSYRNEIKQLLKELARMSRLFGNSVGKEKLSLLRKLSKHSILKHTDLITYHDLLSFFRAYPDSPIVEKMVETELQRFSKRIEKYKTETRDHYGNKLINSGMTDTVTLHQFGFEILRQLMTYHARSLSFDWDTNEETIENAIDEILPHLISWQESDALDYDEQFDLQSWLTTRKPGSDNEALRVLFALFENANLPKPLIRDFFEKLELEITWDLSNSKASRTLQRVSSGRKHYHDKPLLKRTGNLRASIKRPAKPLKLLPEKEGRKYIRIINEVLGVRNRELDPISMANPFEVYLAHPGRGLTIAIYGTQQADRLPMEANFGALLVRNGLPVGYGVAAALLDRVEIAINVFPTFRYGESSFIVEEFFRIFYHHFGSRVFLVRSRQMGNDEPEALHSGSFWFYFKLGFRAVNPRVRKLAESEFQKMKTNPKYRVPLATMKRLSKSDVFFHSDLSKMTSWIELSIINLGYTVSHYFAKNHKGNRKEGLQAAVKKIAPLLGIKNRSHWTETEILALHRLAPLVASISDLRKWSREERYDLGKIIRAKGSKRERLFVRLSNKHSKFKTALEKLARD